MSSSGKAQSLEHIEETSKRMLKYIYERAMRSGVMTRISARNGLTSNCWLLRKIFLIIMALYELYGNCFNDTQFGDIVRKLIDLIGTNPQYIQQEFPDIKPEVIRALQRLYAIQNRQLDDLFESLSEKGESKETWETKIHHILSNKNILSLDFVKQSVNPNDFAGLHATHHSFMIYRGDGNKLYVASGWAGKDFIVPFKIKECTEDELIQFLSVFEWTQEEDVSPPWSKRRKIESERESESESESESERQQKLKIFFDFFRKYFFDNAQKQNGAPLEEDKINQIIMEYWEQRRNFAFYDLFSHYDDVLLVIDKLQPFLFKVPAQCVSDVDPDLGGSRKRKTKKSRRRSKITKKQRRKTKKHSKNKK
jgi:hypothetical protein